MVEGVTGVMAGVTAVHGDGSAWARGDGGGAWSRG